MDFCCKGSRTGSLTSFARDLGAEVFCVPLLPGHVRHVRKLRQVVESGRYDIVHVHTGGYAGIGVWVCKRIGVPTVTTFHSTEFPAQSWTKMPLLRQARAVYVKVSIRYAVSNSEFVTGVSSAVLNALNPGWRKESNWKVLPLGVRFPETMTHSDPAKLRKRLDLKSNTLLIVHVGSFREAKNQLATVRIFRKVLEQRTSDEPPVALVFIGSGMDMEKVRAEVSNSSVSDVVRFLGTRDDVLELVSSCDVSVLPSKYEGFGKVALECASVGIPVVAFDVGGLREAIDHEVTGVLVPPDDEDGLAGAINRLLRSERSRTEMGGAARRHVAKQFSIEVSSETLLGIYRSCIDMNLIEKRRS